MFSIISNCSTSFDLSPRQTHWAPLAGNRLAFALCRNIKNAPSLPSCSLHFTSTTMRPSGGHIAGHQLRQQLNHPSTPTFPHQAITPSTHHANKTTNWILIIFEQKQTSSSALPLAQHSCHAHAADSEALQKLQNATSYTPAVVVSV